MFQSAPVHLDGARVVRREQGTRVCVVAGPEARQAAERAAEVLRAESHAVTVAPIDGLEALADAELVLVRGGLDLEAAARAAAPPHALVRGELLEGPESGWDALVLRSARVAALTGPSSVGCDR